MGEAAVYLPEPTRPVCQTDRTLDPGAVVRHLAHELRQPLSTIESAAYYLKLVCKNDPRLDRQLERIELMVHQMSWILSDASHFLQAARNPPQRIDLAEIFSELLCTEALQQNVELDWTATSASPQVWMDPFQANHLACTVLNVFRQIAGHEKPVFLSFYRNGVNAVLECSCQPVLEIAENCQDLLDPFTLHLPPGSGLALASAKRIVESNYGSISIQSRNGFLKLEIALPAL